MQGGRIITVTYLILPVERLGLGSLLRAQA